MKKDIANKVFSSLLKLYPDPKTELRYINKYIFDFCCAISSINRCFSKYCYKEIIQNCKKPPANDSTWRT